MKDVFSLRATLLSMALLVTPLVIYQLLYFRAFFPVTEGWFSTYAWLIRQGKIPYKDFDLLLPPLYTLQIALIQMLFGEQLIVLRIIGIGVTTGISLTLFGILRKVVTPYSAAFSACVATIYYQSGNAYIGYDFTQFLTLYLLLGLYCFMKHIKISALPEYQRWSMIALLFSGIFFTAATFIKQSNGGITAGIMGICILCILIRIHGMKKSIPYMLFFALGIIIPTLSIILWLFINGALHDFFQQTLFTAISSKGGVHAIFGGWVKGFFGSPNYWAAINQLIHKMAKIVLPLILSSLLIIYITGIILQYRARLSLQLKQVFVTGYRTLRISYNKSALAIGGISAAAIIMMIFYLRFNITSFPAALEDIATTIYNNIILFSLNFYLSGLIIACAIFIWRSTTKNCMWLSLCCFGIALTIGNGTSAGLSEISAFLGLSIALATLIEWATLTVLTAVIPIIPALILSGFLIERKFELPYAWWSTNTNNVHDVSCFKDEKILTGLCMAPSDYQAITNIASEVDKFTKSSDTIFVFPHEPVFYLLTDRVPFQNMVVSWFDFASQAHIHYMAEQLAASPPKAIIMTRLDDSVIAAHERLFNGGMKNEQRNVIRAIDNLSDQHKIRLVLESKVNQLTLQLYVRSDP